MNKNELICLGLIHSKSIHVYIIDEVIKRFKMNEWVNLSRSSIYNTLGKLVKSNYVNLNYEKVGNMPERKVYSITDEGKNFLHDGLIEILEYMNASENLFYLSLGFYFDISKEEAFKYLNLRKKKFSLRIDEYKESYEDAKANNLHHILIQCLAGIKHSEVEIELIDEIIKIYEDHPNYFSDQLRDFYTDVVFKDFD